MSIPKRIMLSLLPVTFLLLLGELGARSYYFYLYRYDPKWLIVPFGNWDAFSDRAPRTPAKYPHRSRQTYRTSFDPCSGRKITFTVNDEGGRGPAWAAAKPADTLRVLAVGESSTFGVTNPDWATWPASLATELRRNGVVIEVMNGGQGGIRLEGINDLLPKWLTRYQPDVVIYYGAWTNAQMVDKNISQFHRSRLGRLVAWLHYRSMLYTYLTEKTYFSTQTWGRWGAVPDVEYFQAQLHRFLQLLRKHKATPILVLQVTQVEQEPSVQDLQLDDYRAVKGLVLKLTKDNAHTTTDKISRIRAYKTQVLVEVVRRTGNAQGVQVIDPRQAFAQYSGASRLFCDEIHLTDLGSQLLASAIAARLDLSTVTDRSARN